MAHGKRYRAAYEKIDRAQRYQPAEAVALIKETASTKFDETVEVHLRLGVNVRHAEEQLRGTLALPHGLGKDVSVAVFADGDGARAAEEAGADFVGAQDLADKVNEGFTDFDVAIATPDLMGPVVSKLGRILGPQGKMPNPKVGTVTNDIAKAVGEAKAGKVEYRTDRQAVIHLTIGKASFEERALLENYAAVVDEIVRAKPAAAKGRYLLSITMATSMGPGVRIDESRTREGDILAGAPSGNGAGARPSPRPPRPSRPPTRMLRSAVAGLLALAATASLGIGSASAASGSDYQNAYKLGLRAYKYGLPLLGTQQTYRTQTSVGQPTHRAYAPANSFSHARKLANPNAKTVVAPNHDTLYSIGWLNLKRQPIVIHVPKVKDRYYVFELLDPYTTNFRNLGTVSHTKPGDYAVVPRGEHVHLPKGVHRVNAPYDRVWVIARALVRGEKDVPRVAKLEKRFTMTPLARYGTDWSRHYPADASKDPTHYKVPTGLRYLDRLGSLLDRFPPPQRDDPILAKLATVGVGPGMSPRRTRSLTRPSGAAFGTRWPTVPTRSSPTSGRRTSTASWPTTAGWSRRPGATAPTTSCERAWPRSASGHWCPTSPSIRWRRSTTPVRT